MNLNGNHHQIQSDKQDAVYHFTNHPVYQNVYTQQCPMFLGHIKHTAIIGTPQPQANIQNTQVNVHNIHSSAHINQINTHNTQPTIHTFQPTTHSLQPSVHNIQVSLHNTQPIPLNTQVIAHNPQVSTHNTQAIAYTIQPSHNTPVTAYNTQVIAHNPQTIVCNEIVAHNTQQQTTLEIIQQNTTLDEIQDTEQPKCLVKDDAKADTQKVSSKNVESNDEEAKCLVTVEVKPVPEDSSKLEKKQKIVGKSKNSVDTSHFTIEERLIAAVWVHERKNIKKSMRQLKQDFHQRFGRKAPAKNTLLGWERKLFSTGCLEDAPRTGRPVKRRSRVEEVAASIRSAPSLSLRARALALRVPTTTLHTILRRDLAVSLAPPSALADTSKSLTKKITKKVKSTKRKLEPPGDTAGADPAPDHFPEAMALC